MGKTIKDILREQQLKREEEERKEQRIHEDKLIQNQKWVEHVKSLRKIYESLSFVPASSTSAGGSKLNIPSEVILNSLKVDGLEVGEYVSYPDVTLSGLYTIYFKIKAYRPYNGTFNAVLSNISSTTNFVFLRDSGVRLRASGTNSDFNGVDTLDGNDHDVILSRDGSNNLSCYIDGVLINTLINAGTLILDSINRYSGGNFGLNGVLIKNLTYCDGYAADLIAAQNINAGATPADTFSSIIRDYNFTVQDNTTEVLVDNVNPINNGTLVNYQRPPEFWRNFDTPFPEITVSNNLNIALYGQSNATSRNDEDTRPADLETEYLNSAIIKFGLKDKMYFGSDGINSFNDVNGNYGVEWRITDRLLGTNNITWHKYGAGGSSVGNGAGFWSATGDYTTAVINEAASFSYSPSWLIWIQGESDASTDINADGYEVALTATFAAFRAAYGAELKIIIVGLYDFLALNSTRVTTIQTAQQAIATAQSNTFYFDPVNDAGIVGGDLLDTLHYNADGIDKIASTVTDIIISN